MDKERRYEYWVDGKCRYELYCSSCMKCLFETLCRLEKEKCRDTTGQGKTGKSTEENI